MRHDRRSVQAHLRSGHAHIPTIDSSRLLLRSTRVFARTRTLSCFLINKNQQLRHLVTPSHTRYDTHTWTFCTVTRGCPHVVNVAKKTAFGGLGLSHFCMDTGLELLPQSLLLCLTELQVDRQTDKQTDMHSLLLH